MDDKHKLMKVYQPNIKGFKKYFCRKKGLVILYA